MKRLTFHLDFVSPFAYLAFERLPQALEGLGYEVEHRPILFAGLLKHWGQIGPAEIAPKRAWTYRHVTWLAQHHGIEFAMPALHPFNPLALLRLAWACAPEAGTPNRHVCESLFRHVWQGGEDAEDPARFAALEHGLQPLRDPRGESVKADLRGATEEAAAAGIFGVPTIAVDGRSFWGLDALEMLADCLRGEAWFGSGAWESSAERPVGVTRPIEGQGFPRSTGKS